MRQRVELDSKDFLTKYGAMNLARFIEQYWHDRGAHHVIADRYQMPGSQDAYGVRSNLVGGLPPRVVR